MGGFNPFDKVKDFVEDTIDFIEDVVDVIVDNVDQIVKSNDLLTIITLGYKF